MVLHTLSFIHTAKILIHPPNIALVCQIQDLSKNRSGSRSCDRIYFVAKKLSFEELLGWKVGTVVQITLRLTSPQQNVILQAM